MSQITAMFLSLLLCSALLTAAGEPMSFAKVTQPSPVLGTSILITGNSTLRSPNQTFEIGFFTLDGGAAASWYLGIWYASIPIRTYVWVANRAAPVPARLTPATLELSPDGRLRLRDSAGREVWAAGNTDPAAEARLLDTGNLVLLAPPGGTTEVMVWQSLDELGDTWLPGMAVTPRRSITGWRSASDPAPGPYSLRLRPPEYGEFELVYRDDSASSSRWVRYWSTGRWMGNRFTGVPEMTVPYIYTFRFDNPFTPEASFVYNQKPPLVVGLPGPLLTRFVVDPSGQFRQYTWSAQAASWEMFWSRPEDPCDVHALCGDLGFCLTGREGGFRPCMCLPGLQPVYPAAWGSGDFSGGCRPSVPCNIGNASTENDGGDEFADLGAAELDAEKWVSMSEESRWSCEESCRKNCSCRGISYVPESRLCRCLFGAVLNLRNASRSGSTTQQVLYLRLPANSSASDLRSSPTSSERPKWRAVEIVSGSVGGIVLLSGVAAGLMLHRRRKRKRGRREGRFRSKKGSQDLGSEITRDDDIFSSKRGGEPALAANLQVFSYKELSAATRGFSEKLGHGGFGAVFRGELPDSTLVAVKRLERRGGGDREFRAEVRTIGSVQHVNLVRLRGFCSEDPHRILVYEYMPNGPLSNYLLRGRARPPEEDKDQDGTAAPSSSSRPPPRPPPPLPSEAVLPWSVRFRVAVGTARALAYLHEECRDCIIHCDIKPENILLDGAFAAKVSDFGMAKLLGRDLSRVLTTMRGTWGYVAPEWISGVAITAKADVYSYGMTLLEIISGRRNVQAPPPSDEEEEDKEEREKWFFPPWAARRVVEGDVAAVVDPRLLQDASSGASGGYDAEEARRAAVTAVWCIQDQEAARPSMGTVVKLLEGTIEVGVPPLPQLLQALVSGDSFPRDAAAALGGSGAGSRSTTTSTLGD